MTCNFGDRRRIQGRRHVPEARGARAQLADLEGGPIQVSHLDAGRAVPSLAASKLRLSAVDSGRTPTRWPMRDHDHTGPLVVYLMDPHCGWCFGHHRVVSKLADLHGNTGSEPGLRVVPGGLFIPRRAWSAEQGETKRPVAARIEQAFGVHFSDEYFRNVLGGPWIDSGPPCRAVLTGEALGANPLELAGCLLRAAFEQGRNISDPLVVAELAADFGFDREAFQDAMQSETVQGRLAAAVDFATRAGTGFPSVFLQAAPDTPLRRLGGSELSADDILASISSAA